MTDYLIKSFDFTEELIIKNNYANENELITNYNNFIINANNNSYRNKPMIRSATYSDSDLPYDININNNFQSYYNTNDPNIITPKAATATIGPGTAAGAAAGTGTGTAAGTGAAAAAGAAGTGAAAGAGGAAGAGSGAAAGTGTGTGAAGAGTGAAAGAGTGAAAGAGTGAAAGAAGAGATKESFKDYFKDLREGFKDYYAFNN